MNAIKRRDFLKAGGAAALLCGLPGCMTGRTASASGTKWQKGMLHCHTYWSDGRGFPEDAAAAYKALGYNFISITDHNRVGASEYWREVKPEDGPWPPNVSQAIFDHYVSTFHHAKTRVTNGKTEVRIQPIAETCRMFSEDGKYLIMPGVEITRDMPIPEVRLKRALHTNIVNLPEPIPSVVGQPLISKRHNLSVKEMLAADFAEYRALAAKHPSMPSMFMLNHPHWPALDVIAADLASIPELRFFEVCNNGAELFKEGALVDDGWRNDRIWDMANAMRARAGMPLIFGVGTDDAHWYPGNGTAVLARAAGTPGDAYVRVAADELSPASIFSAMYTGNFHASSGVDPDAVDFDGNTLSVSVPAKPGVSYAVRFIVTKRDFSATPSKVLPIKFARFDRNEELLGEGVGVTAALIRGGSGEAVSAAYTLKSDDLYVRARIESDEPSFVKAHFHPTIKCAWTQPYMA